MSTLARSDVLLRQLDDAPLRRLLRGVPDDQPAQMGKTCNVELYRVMLQCVKSVDQDLPDLLLHGFPIVGAIARANRWPDYPKEQTVVPLEELQRRAWDIRKKIVQRVASLPGGPPTSQSFGRQLWKMFMTALALALFRMSVSIGFLMIGSRPKGFEVVQKNKVRGCDSATTNLINQATLITEKLQLPSTDTNVAVLRTLRSKCPSQDLVGWVLDEKKANGKACFLYHGGSFLWARISSLQLQS